MDVTSLLTISMRIERSLLVVNAVRVWTLYHFAHREYRRDQSMSSSPPVFEISFVISIKKEQLPVLVSRARSYSAVPLIAAKEEHPFRVIHVSVVPGNRGSRRQCRKG